MKVYFLVAAPVASQVELAGEFNNWARGDLMAKDGHGNWYAEKDLDAGVYAYKFIIDGVWADADAATKQVGGVKNPRVVLGGPRITYKNTYDSTDGESYFVVMPTSPRDGDFVVAVNGSGNAWTASTAGPAGDGSPILGSAAIPSNKNRVFIRAGGAWINTCVP